MSPAFGAQADIHTSASRNDACRLRREGAALLILHRSGRLSFARYSDAIEEHGGAIAVLRRERLQREPQTTLFSDPERDLADELSAAERQISGWAREGLRLISLLDPAYPPNLRAAHDRPPFVFVHGRMKPRDDRAVAVIGSRRATSAGLRATGELSRHLVQRGYTVASGLAAGIDTAAHTAALKAGGRTLAVVGTGLRLCYPRANVILQRRIAAQCAVVSQFLPDAPPSRQSFPMRNAVMSGMSLASVIVEASYTSGARIQARSALRQGRPVFLLAPLLRQRWAQELAQRPGVHVAETPLEVTATLDRLFADETLVA